MDFIVKLLKSKESGTGKLYDFIYVIINKLTKYGYFISYREDILVKDLVYLFN
jgi:hypothetical protein